MPEIGQTLRVLADSLDQYVDGPVQVAITHELTRTGAPLILLELLKQLHAHHGWRTVLLSQGAAGPLSEEFEDPCLLVVPNLDLALRVAPDEVQRLLRVLLSRAAQPTVLLNSIVSRRLGSACHQAGFGIVALIHEYPDKLRIDALERFLAICGAVVFPCPDVCVKFQETLATAGAALPAETRVIPQGCYLLERPPLSSAVLHAFARDFRHRNNLPDARLVLCCGTVDTRKGFDWLVELLLFHAKTSPNAALTRFIWLGRVRDAALYARGLESLRKAGLADYLIHVEETDDVRPYLALADIFLLCSRLDPFPSVALESLLMGKPVLAFDQNQGCRDLLVETGFGRLCPFLDASAASRLLDEMLADPHLAQRVSDQAPGYIARHFRFAQYTERVHHLYTHSSTAPARQTQAA